MDNMRLCEEHRKYQQIFYLEKMLKEAGYPYHFNFNADYPNIIWGEYKFCIEIGHKAGYKKAMLEIFFDGGMLKLYDYRKNKVPEFFDSLMAEDCMLMIEELFRKYLSNSTQKHSTKC